jgi:hypothetical protein
MRLKRALLVLVAPGLASLGGCELIAGVRDITDTDAGADNDASAANEDVRGDAAPGTVGDGTVFERDAVANMDGVGADRGQEEAGEADTAEGDEEDAQPEAAKRDAALDGTSADAGFSYVLIDDMEANTGEISAPGGGNGYWFTYGDLTDGGVEIPATMASFTDSMVSPPRVVPASFVSFSGPMSNYAAQVHGMGFASYAGMGFNFRSSQAGYNASSYVGFVFWGRMTGTGSGAVTFVVPDANTLPAGGVCTTCDDYFFTDITLTSSWQQFTVYYSDLAQQGFGVPQESALDAASVYKVLFQVSTKAPPGEAFDIWIDDIYFIIAL